MIEQLIFIVISMSLGGAILYKAIKSKDREYLIILICGIVGILLNIFGIIFKFKINLFFKFIIYIISIIIPGVIIFCEYKKIDILNSINFLLVKFYMSTNNLKNAKKILINLIEKKPKNYNAHKLLAELYEKEGGIRKAIDEYVICIEINKQDYKSYYKISTLLTDLEKKDEAIQMLYTLLDKKPDYYEATLSLGDLLIENEKYKEAASILIDGLKYNPTSFELNYELGIVCTLLNDFKNAKEYYEKAAELNSLSYNTKYSLAEIALLYKDLDLAEEYFEEALEDEDLSADSYFELSKIKLLRGEKERAIKYANIAIDLDSKKISEKIKKEPLFMTIISKISIPFNLEERENTKLLEKEIKAKEHLENTTDITMNMGYVNIKHQIEEKDTEKNITYKERENL